MKRFRAVLWVLLLVVGVGLMSYATIDSQIEKNRKELERVRNLLQNVDANQQNNKKQQTAVEREISSLETLIRKLESEITDLEKSIMDTLADIDVKTAELSAAEDNIHLKNELMNDRLVVMYKSGSIGYLEVLLGANDFADLLSRIDALSMVFEHDKELLAYLKEQRDIIVQHKADLEVKRAALETYKGDLELKQMDHRASVNVLGSKKKSLEADAVVLERQVDALNEDAEKITKIIASLELKKKYVGGVMVWPAPNHYKITSPFGFRIHPILKTKKQHTGIDIQVPSGSTIVAAQGGNVVYSDWLGGYGKTVMIDHGGGILTLYGHNSSLLVKEGQAVNKGDKIALSGSTGLSTGPHLHFEVRENGKYVDPMKYVTSN